MIRRAWFVLFWVILVMAAISAGAEHEILINGDQPPLTWEESLDMVQQASDAYLRDSAVAAELENELHSETLIFEDEDDGGEADELIIHTLTHDGQSMQFLMEIMGEPGENGYPLYLTLHGGGSCPQEQNDAEWSIMFSYYKAAVRSGIYIAVRGITDTWDMHFRPESYPLYDRLIQAMIRLYHADPDRVYLLGFSAGGDGVYQIAPRMADRFAAANMSSGHPNGVSLRNLANLPISIQVGVRDYYSEDALRCVRAAEFDQVLNDDHATNGYGYAHQVLIRVPAGHNFDDVTDAGAAQGDEWALAEVLADPAAYANPEVVTPLMRRFRQACEEAFGVDSVEDMSYVPEGISPAFDSAVRRIVTEEFYLATKLVNGSAAHYVSQFTRNPTPALIEWELDTRADTRNVQCFYWLRAEPSVNQGRIQAMDLGDNRLAITPDGLNGDFSILVNPRMLDVSRPIRISTPDGEFTVRVNPSSATLRSALRETGDPALAWVAEIPYSLLSSGK